MAGGGRGVGMGDLPEECISIILSLTSPTDALQLAAVSKKFCSAAGSDLVWERFLPADYRDILSRTAEQLEFSSKKDLFQRLSTEPVLIDEGKKSFGLERSTGKKCLMLSARDITIIWSDEPEYWRWICPPPEESRFSEVAELQYVCWLEIRRKISMEDLSPLTTYSAYLIYKLTDDTYGFSGVPHETRLYIGSLPPLTCTAYLLPGEPQQQLQEETAENTPPRVPRTREDGWIELALGDFFNQSGDQAETVEMGLYETKILTWKFGLRVQGIELRPKEE